MPCPSFVTDLGFTQFLVFHPAQIPAEATINLSFNEDYFRRVAGDAHFKKIGELP